MTETETRQRLLKAPRLNQITIAGNLTEDGKSRTTAGGRDVANFRMAANESYQNAQGEWKQESTFVNVTCWGYLVEKVVKQGFKGAVVVVTGKLKTHAYQTKDGQEVSNNEILANSVQFLDKPEKDEVQETQVENY